MAEMIEDGTTGAYRAKVNSMNMLSVLAAGVSLQHYVAHKDKNAYSMVVQQTLTGAGSCFAYMKNTNTLDLNVWKVLTWCAAAEAIEVWTVTGTATGTDYTPVNFVVGSGKQPQATAIVGNGVTGLTKVSLLKRYRCEAGKQDPQWINSSIIIPEDQAIAFYAVTGTALTELNIAFDFHSEL